MITGFKTQGNKKCTGGHKCGLKDINQEPRETKRGSGSGTPGKKKSGKYINVENNFKFHPEFRQPKPFDDCFELVATN